MQARHKAFKGLIHPDPYQNDDYVVIRWGFAEVLSGNG